MKIIILTFLCMLFFSCENNNSYTLYRDSLIDSGLRIHVATFDSNDGNKDALYNKENCEIAKKLFSSQAESKSNFWCEKGMFKK